MIQGVALGIGGFATCAFLATIFVGSRRTRKDIEAVRKNAGVAELPTVAAGSHFKSFPSKVETVSLKYNGFLDASGQPIDTSLYNGYIVKGQSMQFCGIKPDDLVLARKDFQTSDLTTFPKVVVLRNVDADPRNCSFKMRRAWRICHDDLSEEEFFRIIDGILASESYNKLRNDACGIYTTDTEMRKSFKDKLDDYIKRRVNKCRIVISTTYNVDSNKIEFSIHRASLIVGIVEYCFDLKHNCASFTS